MRINGSDKVNMTPEIKNQIMDVILRYGTGELLRAKQATRRLNERVLYIYRTYVLLVPSFAIQ